MEPLENRRVLSAVDLLVSVDGFASDSDQNGSFDALNTTDETFLARKTIPPYYGESRALLEFDLRQLNANHISTATLQLYVGSYSYTSLDGRVDLEFRGYFGDGSLALSDATAGGTVIGTLTDIRTGAQTVSINADFLRSAAQAGGFAGITVHVTKGNDALFTSREEKFYVYTPPTLHIDVLSPVTRDDLYRVDRNTTFTATAAAGVLANDVGSGGTVIAGPVSSPANGTLVLNTDGGFTYTPNAGFTGTDRFTYQAVESGYASRTTTVTFQVTPPAAAVTSFSTDTGVAGDGLTTDRTLVLEGTADPGSVVTVFGPQSLLVSINESGTGSDEIQSFALPHASGGWLPTDFVPVTDPEGMVLSPNGTDLYVGTDTGIVRLDVTNPFVQFTVASGTGRIFALAISPDGQTLFAADYDGNKVRKIDLATGAVSDFLTGLQGPTGLAVSADGQFLFVANVGINANPGNGYVDRYRIATGQVDGPRATGFTGSTALSLSPDGKYVFAGTGTIKFSGPTDRMMRIDAATMQSVEIAEIGYRKGISGFAWESPTSLFVTADDNSNTIVHYGMGNGLIQGPVSGYGISGSPRGVVLLSAYGRTVADASGHWTFDGSNLPLADGTYTFTARMTSDQGITGPAGAGITVTIDGMAPAAPLLQSISDDTSSVGDEVTSDRTLLINGTAEAGSTVEVFRDGISIGTTTAAAGGAWTFDDTATVLADGTYVYTARATDRAGNVSILSTGITVVVDGLAPGAPAVLQITDDTGTPGDGITSDRTLFISGTAEAGIRVDVYRNSAFIGLVFANASGAWSYNDTNTTLSDGNYSFTARAIDKAGNVGQFSAPLLVTVDNVAPANPAITSVSDDTGASPSDRITQDQTLVFTGTAPLGTTVQILRDGVVIGTTTTAANGTWTFDSSDTVLADGTYAFTARAVDAAGNVSGASATFSVKVDTTAPLTDSVARMVADLRTDGPSEYIETGGAFNKAVVLNGVAYFFAVDETTGTGLYRTNGSPAGTELVQAFGSTIGVIASKMRAINGRLWFGLTDGYVWTSDGTTAGTARLQRIVPASQTQPFSTVKQFVEMGGVVYFAVDYGANNGGGGAVWRSDGTASGTVLVKEFPNSISGSGPDGLTVVGNTLFFAAHTNAVGVELWKSDGTTEGTVLVKDIHTTSSSSPTALTAYRGKLYFRAIDSSTGSELWTSDGTEAGTVRVADIRPGSVSSFPLDLTVVGDTLYFTADDGSTGRELWSTDGVSVTRITDLLQGATNPTNMVEFQGKLWFQGITASSGVELYQSDGTTAGTKAIDVVPGSGSSSPSDLTVVNGRLYFSGATSSGDKELWVTDGTSAGTRQVVDLYPNGFSSNPGTMTALGDSLLFRASTMQNGREFWISDGTAAGTTLVSDINTSGNSSAETESISLAEAGGYVYFRANVQGTGTELWRTDGTEAGTTLVADINPGASGSFPRTMTAVGNTLYFAATGPGVGVELYKTDGTAAGTVLVKDILPGGGEGFPTQLLNVNGTLFFLASDGVNGTELWKSDGTAAGTVMVKDIAAGGASSLISQLVNIGGTVYFAALDRTAGVELWKSDGTAAGTVVVRDIYTGSNSSSPTQLTVMGSTLYFVANSGINGSELWKSDGTSSGTVIVKDIVSGAGSSSPASLMAVGSTLYFTATTSANGTELWKSDGTSAGTSMVVDLTPNGSSSLGSFTAFNGQLIFTQTFATTGNVIVWKTDGTAAGTVQLATLQNVDALRVVGDTLYFLASHNTYGRELWKSDGTAAGTQFFADIRPGPQSGFLANLTSLGGSLYFTAADGPHGRELWVVPPGRSTTPLVTSVSEDRGTAGDGLTSDNTLVVGGRAEAGSLVELFRDGVSLGSVVTDALGNWSFDATATALADGTYRFTARATDLAGNATASSPEFVVTIDTSAPASPSGLAVSEADGSTSSDAVTADTRPTITGTAAAATLVEVLVDGLSIGTATSDSQGQWSVDVTGLPLSLGTHLIAARTVDAAGNRSSDASLSITVIDPPDAPVAADDAYQTAEDTQLLVAASGVLANDTDADGDALAAVLVDGPQHGSLTLNANGSFTYTPDANYNGLDSFTYRASDGGLESDVATVTLTVNSVQDPPVATDDSYSTREDTALTVAAPGVLENDTDVEGDALTTALWSGPSHGQLALNADGSFTYTPDADYSGTDAFTYRVFAGQQSAFGTVTLTVEAVQDVPVASDDAYAVDEDSSLTVAAAGVLDNDSDADSESLTAVLVSGPTNGSLSLDSSGAFVYTPSANFHGQDSFTYRASDGIDDSDLATVTITVASVDDSPTAADDEYSTAEDTALVVQAAGVLANDGDIDGDALTAVLVSGPSNGQLSLNADGSFTYTPDANFTGADSFTYRASANGVQTANATVTIAVVTVQDVPVADDDTYTVDEDSTLTVAAAGVLANDSDADGESLTAVLVSGPTNGSLSLDSSGAFVYTPSANFHGQDSFTYRANDGIDDSSLATVTIAVAPVDDSPTAADDEYSTAEDTALVVQAAGVLANDGDIDGDALTAVLVSGPSNGQLSLNADGSFTYTPDVNFAGTDSFTYRARANGVQTADATVTIAVVTVQDVPVADDDTYTVDEDSTLTVAAAGVLANDSDADGESLTAALVSGPTNGSLSLDSSGAFVYTPSANFHGQDSFTYRANDGIDDSNLATVTITVASVDDSPTAADDEYSTAEDTALVVQAAGVLANDGDIDGDALTAVLVSGPSNGQLSLNADGSFTYTPDVNFAGTDSFTYRARANGVQTADATVTIAVVTVQDVPVADDDTYTVDEDSTLTVAAAGVLANDSDADGESLTAALVSGPANGSLALDSSGAFVYTPNANFHGQDSFTYRANDGIDDSNLATVTITVASVDDSPTAADDEYSTAEDTALVVQAAGVLANDEDIDGDALSATLVSGPSHGQLTLNSDGSFTYTPDADYSGTDSFTYRATANGVQTAAATVTIAVEAVLDPPVAVADSFSTDEDTTLTVAAAGVLANDTDADGDALRALLLAGPAHGQLSLDSTGAFVYTPDSNFNGRDSFTYRAFDGFEASNVVTVSITVSAVNDAPTAADDAYSLNEDWALSIEAAGVLANDGDVDGNPLSAALVSGPSNGSLTLNANGSFTYTPNAHFNGADSFTYRVSDGSATSGLATVRLTVQAVNDAPVAGNNTYSVNEDQTLTVIAPGVLHNDSDVEGSTLTALLVSGPAHGSLTLNANGSFTYTPFANYNGSDSFTYRASDGSAQSGTATVTINVAAVNDAPTDLLLSNASIAERTNTSTAVTVGLLSAADVDGSAGHTFSLVAGTGSTDNATFQITGSQLQVKAGTVLDYEQKSSYSVRVRVTDGGLTFEKAFTISVTDVLEAAIDVKPADSTNTIDLARESTISVAILSTGTFNALTDVVLASLTFGRTGFENSAARNKKGQILFTQQDVNGDGLLDLVVQFTTSATGLQVGDTSATLRGTLSDGSKFAATSAIRVISTPKGGGGSGGGGGSSGGNTRGGSQSSSTDYAALDAAYAESDTSSDGTFEPKKK